MVSTIFFDQLSDVGVEEGSTVIEYDSLGNAEPGKLSWMKLATAVLVARRRDTALTHLVWHFVAVRIYI